jgi:hypothetical protein
MDKNNVRQTDLAVSRDGTDWATYAKLGMYIPNGQKFNGETIVETLAQGGLVRRDDRIWQYAQYVTGAHGGGTRYSVRLTQRLDGFVSLYSGREKGVIVTRPFVFEGRKLVLNVAAKGNVLVEIQDQDKKAIKGFSITDCDPIKSDTVRHIVTWTGSTDVGNLAGKVVRLRFEMQNAKLFALEFD